MNTALPRLIRFSGRILQTVFSHGPSGWYEVDTISLRRQANSAEKDGVRFPSDQGRQRGVCSHTIFICSSSSSAAGKQTILSSSGILSVFLQACAACQSIPAWGLAIARRPDICPACRQCVSCSAVNLAVVGRRPGYGRPFQRFTVLYALLAACSQRNHHRKVVQPGSATSGDSLVLAY